MTEGILKYRNVLLSSLVLGCLFAVIFLPSFISISEQRNIGESPNLLPAWQYNHYKLSLEVSEVTQYIPYNVFVDLKALPYQLERLCKGCGTTTKETKYGYKMSEVMQSIGITFAQLKENPFIWFIGKDGYTQIKDYSAATSWTDVDDVVSVTGSNLPKRYDKFNTPIGFFDTDNLAHDDIKDATGIVLKKEGKEGAFFLTPEGKIPEFMLNPVEKPAFDASTFALTVMINGAENKISYEELKENAAIIDSPDGNLQFIPLMYFVQKYNLKDIKYLELFSYDSYAWHPFDRLKHDDIGFVLTDASAEKFGSPVDFCTPKDKNYPIGKAGILKGNLKIAFTTE